MFSLLCACPCNTSPHDSGRCNASVRIRTAINVFAEGVTSLHVNGADAVAVAELVCVLGHLDLLSSVVVFYHLPREVSG